MMTATAKRKSDPIPTLAERVEALKEEVEAELDRLAELHRPPSIPGPWIRQNWMGKGGGNVFEAYLAAVREFPQ
jgi:hypothetical protein